METIQFKKFDSYEELSRSAAEYVGHVVIKNPEMMLCPATGNSPERCYDILADADISFSDVTLLMLDEWGDVPPTHPASCSFYLRTRLTEPLGIEKKISFDTQLPVDQETDKMNDFLVNNGPIDLCILGIGKNGHLGFNEPADFLEPFAHKVHLTTESLNHQMISTLDKKPTYGITLGMSQILQSKRIILLVNGSHKKEIMETFMKQQITPHVPASFLWMHPNVTVFCDQDACPTN
jgi:galactosamine-6-phosphate isomerase